MGLSRKDSGGWREHAKGESFERGGAEEWIRAEGETDGWIGEGKQQEGIQARFFTEATKVIASMPPGQCLGALEMIQ